MIRRVGAEKWLESPVAEGRPKKARVKARRERLDEGEIARDPLGRKQGEVARAGPNRCQE